MTNRTFFVLSFFLMTCADVAYNSEVDSENAKRRTVISKRPPNWILNECGGVAITPKILVSAHHCYSSKDVIHVITLNDYYSNALPHEAVKLICESGWAFIEGFVDGWCAFKITGDYELPYSYEPGAPNAGELCTFVGHGNLRQWNAIEVRLERDGPNRGSWKAIPHLTDYRFSGGDSGGPIICNQRAVGVMSAKSGHFVPLDIDLAELETLAREVK